MYVVKYKAFKTLFLELIVSEKQNTFGGNNIKQRARVFQQCNQTLELNRQGNQFVK